MAKQPPKTNPKSFPEILEESKIIEGFKTPIKSNEIDKIMIPVLVEKMTNLVFAEYQKNPLKGTPLKSTTILKIMNKHRICLK